MKAVWISPFKELIVAVGFIAGILGVGALGYTFYLDELYPSPPSQDPGPQIGPVERKVDRLVIVVIDSVREDLMNDAAIMPGLDAIAQNGRRGIAIAQPVTMTLLSVLNLATGRTPGLAWSVHNFQADTFPDESIFYWAHANGLKTAFMGDAAWSQLFGRWASFDATHPDGGMYDAVEDMLARKDHEALASANEILAKPEDYDIVVVHLISTDHVAHGSGALLRDPKTGELTEYARTAKVVDGVVADLHMRFSQPGDMWFITSDHGCTDTGQHGGGDEVARRAPFVLVGAGVREGPPVQTSMNVWAATFSVVLGLPIPRTAEQAAAFELLTLTASEKVAALEAHAARRQEFVDGIARAMGARASAPSRDTAWFFAAAGPEGLIVASNQVIQQLRLHRRWLQILGLVLGAILHLLAAYLLLYRTRPQTTRRSPTGWLIVLGVASAWLLVVSVPLVFDDWLFGFVATLGYALDGPWHFGKAALLLAGGTAATSRIVRVVVRQDDQRHALLKRALMWLSFVFVVIATSHIVVKWPFGPLAETYLALLVWGGVCGLWFGWRWEASRRTWLAVAASVVAIVALFIVTGDSHMQLLQETTGSLWSAATLCGLGVVVLLARASLRESDRRHWVAGVAIAALLLLAMLVYRGWPEPLAAHVALLALGAGGVLAASRRWSVASRRDALFAVVIALAHVMSSDWIALMTLAFVVLVAALSALHLPRRAWMPAVIASCVGILDIAFFYVSGYRYAFPAIDVKVVFMLDQSTINLVAGFFLLSLQHSPMWILLWAAVVANRHAAEDRASLPKIVVGVVLIFLIRAWGPFVAMEFKLLNHWYISHAVPMFVMTTVECALATFWYAVATFVLGHRAPRAVPAAKQTHQSEPAALRPGSAAAQ